MAKSPRSESLGNQESLERMNKALKKMLETPPETHEEMVRRQKSAKKPTTKKRTGF